MKIALLDRLLDRCRHNDVVAVATHLESGRQALWDGNVAHGDLDLDEALCASLSELLARGESRVVETPGGAVFAEIWSPPAHLVIVGAAHIAQVLTTMAVLSGYRVSIVDPRSSFASRERFVQAEVINTWPDEALAALKVNSRTAVVALSHDPKIDDPALRFAVRSPAFYVGALGSRRTHAKRVERLAAAGFGAREIARIHAPVGLDIGALTQGEIAVSILAQMTATLRAARIKRPADEA